MTTLLFLATVMTIAPGVWHRRRSCARRAEAVATASHELRGPLQAALLGLAALSRPQHPTDAATRARVLAVERELMRAQLALGDLDAAHGRTVEAEYPELVDVGALLADQVEAWQAMAQHHGRSLRLSDGNGTAVTLVDPRRLAQATGNLIANALEHGAGHVDIAIRSDPGRIRIEVADEGPGLPAPVHRLVAVRRRPQELRGRGLKVAADVAARHGGRLAAAPCAGGCRIVLELPRTSARAA